MKTLIALFIIAAGLMVLPVTSNAQAPSGSTGECKDGTYTSAASKSGACSGHGGVKAWYSGTPAAKAPTTPAANAPVTPAATPPAARTSAPSSAAGGGPGMVWVNTKSKIYHCQGDRWYGKTKHGEYMTEAAAKAAGNRPDHNKACA